MKAHWPIITTIGAGLVGFGALSADVKHIERAQAQIEVGTPAMQERVTRIEERQQSMAEDVKEMKGDIKDIARAVKN